LTLTSKSKNMHDIVARAITVGKARIAERAMERREQIARGASAVLRTRRSGALRMEEVADRLGLVKGNIYYYFKDRQDLIYHCHERCIEMSIQALGEIAGKNASAEERLRELLRRHIEIIIGSEYGGAVLADIDELKPSQRRRNVAMRDKFEAGVRKLISEGIAGGEFRKTDVTLAGFAMLGAINWIPKWHRAGGALKVKEIAIWFADFSIRALKR
jgi:AcrR family transcriptional regulator